MAVELKVPSVGESITVVQIGEWLKPEGSFASENEPVVVIETEKASLEVPAPISGKVTQVLKKSGEEAAVGEVIGRMEEAAKPAEATKDKAAPQPPAQPSPQPPLQSKAPAPQPSPQPPAEPPAQPIPEAQPGPGPVIPQGAVASFLPEPLSTDRAERIVPMTPIRRRIAERLVAAQQNAALLTTFNEVDMFAIVELRTKYREAFQQRHGVKLGIVSFFVRAVIESLKQIPQLNAEVRDQSLVYRDFYDIGIAIGAEKGLVVPVLRNAERLSLVEIEKAIAGFVERAGKNQLSIEELQGGTFTISNGGIYGSLLSTPIVNAPQSGVLGLHAIADRAVVRNGQIVARPMMYVALTYDHRVVDGREAVTFLRHVKELIEEPALVLLGL
jgi:2-oxoglutarate dehydrogenase E2 component (dihydrolipoamide succinyltransferase)